MAISSDLVSQFVKITKDESKNKSESIVYGTIQKNTKYVKIDGSDILTPISSTTVVKENDRVTVMIKNHSAIVTGNLTSPSARNSDVIDIEKLNIEKARIDTLEATNVTIQETLNANSADIDTLQIDNVNIKNALTSNTADIVTLKSNDVIISGKVSANESAINDLRTESENAAKTATNYLKFSSNGLVVGDMASNTLGKNILIDNDRVGIRNGTTTLASFGSDKVTMNNPLVLNGITFTGKNKVLWSGGYYMSDTQTAMLSESISTQPNGVVLLWSYYVDGASDNSNFQPFFIPKQFVDSHNGKGISMFMTDGSLSVAASKYVYISDTSIKGHANNNDEPSTKTCGITSTPKNFVLRYVIGV